MENTVDLSLGLSMTLIIFSVSYAPLDKNDLWHTLWLRSFPRNANAVDDHISSLEFTVWQPHTHIRSETFDFYVSHYG